MSNWKEFTKGIVKENPVFVSLLGMCPTLAITTAAKNGVGMGLATTLVLVCTNIIISMLKNIIPDTVRLPAYIVTISGFSSLIGVLMSAYLPDVYAALGIYIPLIAVNCIIMGRAEVFAAKNKVFPSLLDALGAGIGFTLAITLIGSIREVFGLGTIFGLKIMPEAVEPMMIFIMPAGGFFVLGILIALINKIANRPPPAEMGCESCSNKGACGISHTPQEENS